MRPQGESRAARSAVELDAEEEIDLGRYWRAILARWWLLVLGLIVGAAVGLLATTGQSRSYGARTLVYLGQPFAPGGTTPIQNLQTRIGIVGQFALTRRTVNEVAQEAGIRPAVLRARISTKTLAASSRARADQLTPLLEIRVRDLPPRKAVDAADALARVIVDEVSAYVDVKLGTYQARLDRNKRELKKVNERLEFAVKEQAEILKDRSIPVVERLIFVANFNNVLTFNEQRRSSLETSELGLRDLVALARGVERAAIVEPAIAERSSPPSRRSAGAIGAAIGLILGALAAIAWAPLERRFRRSRPAPSA